MLTVLLQNARVYYENAVQQLDLLIVDGKVISVGSGIAGCDGVSAIDASNLYIFPGFADVHVHLREPGFSYKETIATGTAAAAKGGFTLVASMPNVNPVPDTARNVKVQQEIIDRDGKIKVLPYGAITAGQKGERLADLEELAQSGCFAFSDDGKGVQATAFMEQAMERAKKLNKAIVAHCEDESLTGGGYIHQGEYAALHNHKGICSESEWLPVKRDIELVRKTGAQYHICHISAKETVDLVRKAKKDGLPVTCETAPHYLVFSDMDLKEDGRFKMNPPIRAKEDRAALIEGITDGTIDVISTDHAPHSKAEKTKGLQDSNMGVVGLETSFAAINTFLVKTGKIDYSRLVQLMSVNPRKIFGLDSGIQIGKYADLVIVDTEKRWNVKGENFVSLGKYTPFEGMELQGEVLATVYMGKTVYTNGRLEI